MIVEGPGTHTRAPPIHPWPPAHDARRPRSSQRGSGGASRRKKEAARDDGGLGLGLVVPQPPSLILCAGHPAAPLVPRRQGTRAFSVMLRAGSPPSLSTPGTPRPLPRCRPASSSSPRHGLPCVLVVAALRLTKHAAPTPTPLRRRAPIHAAAMERRPRGLHGAPGGNYAHVPGPLSATRACSLARARPPRPSRDCLARYDVADSGEMGLEPLISSVTRSFACCCFP